MKRCITPGQDLVMIGDVGTYAVRVLLNERRDEIEKRFGRAYLREEIEKLDARACRPEGSPSDVQDPKEHLLPGDFNSLQRPESRSSELLTESASASAVHPEFSTASTFASAVHSELSTVPASASEAVPELLEQLLPGCQTLYGISKCWPVGKGGALKALWDFCASEGLDLETGKKRNDGVGCTFRYDRIPIRQFTMEICELFDLFPYRLWSENCWLVAAEKGTQLVDDFRSAQEARAKASADAVFEQGSRVGFDATHHRTDIDLPAAVIGRFTKGKKRLRVDGAEISYLTRENYEALERYFAYSKGLKS